MYDTANEVPLAEPHARIRGASVAEADHAERPDARDGLKPVELAVGRLDVSPACAYGGIETCVVPATVVPRTMAERRQESWVARQLGHSVAMLQSTYWHLIAEYEEAERVDATAEILAARRGAATRADVRHAS
jgi:hypothetical protein